MNYSSRFWLYAPLCLFLILAAGVAVHWWRAASAFDKKLDAMKGHDAVPGIVIDWQAKTLSGFPFRLDVVFDDFSVRAEAPRGPLTWHSDHFALHSLTYGRTQDIYEAAGNQTLTSAPPPGRLVMLSRPPCASTISRHKVRPRPVPVCFVE